MAIPKLSGEAVAPEEVTYGPSKYISPASTATWVSAGEDFLTIRAINMAAIVVPTALTSRAEKNGALNIVLIVPVKNKYTGGKFVTMYGWVSIGLNITPQLID